MNRIFFFAASLFSMLSAAAQPADTVLWSREELDKAKVYTRLEDALQEPGRVLVLDLSGQQLDSLPAGIAQLKNLQVLRLGFRVKPTTPKSVIRQSKKVGGGIVHLDGLRGRYLDYNHLLTLPQWLGSLRRLQQIDLKYNSFTEVPFMLAELKQLKYVNLVGCYGLLDRQDDLRNLKSLLPPGCVLATDMRLE